MRRLGIAVLWMLWRLLPAGWLSRLGAALGWLLFHLGRARRHIADTNLRLCFPEWDDARRERVLRAHFMAFGAASLQQTTSWWGSRAEVERLNRLEGVDCVTPHLGKPLIFLAPHFVGATIAGVRFPVTLTPIVSLYSAIKNPHVDRLMFQARTRFDLQGVHSEMYSRQDGIKPVLRAIKRGLPFYYLPDMDFGRKDAVFVPFFGIPTATVSALPRLCKASGAVVVPAITRREGNGFVTRFYPAWTDYPSEDMEADVRRMNAFIEDRIREMPEQYFWLHKRFKTRPEGEPGVYD